MSHDNICTTIKELHEKAESIRAQMMKNAEIAGTRGGGSERIDPERMTRGMETREQNRKLKPKLIDVYNALGDVHQQKGDERRARFYHDQAERSR